MRNHRRLREVSNSIDQLLDNPTEIAVLYGCSIEDARADIDDFKRNRDLAYQGDEKVRLSVVDFYVQLLTALGFNQETDEGRANLHELIDFEHLLNNDESILFEMLLRVDDLYNYFDRYEIGHVIREVDYTELSDEELLTPRDEEYPEKFSKKKLLQIVKREEDKLTKHFSNTNARLSLLAHQIYAEFYGYGPIDTLAHHGINELAFIRWDYIYVTHKGVKVWMEFLKFRDKKSLNQLQLKATFAATIKYEESNPSVVSSKLNSSRITVSGHEMTGENEWYYNERYFNLGSIKLEEMMDRFKTIDIVIYTLMVLNQRGKGKYLVSGSDMGVGKSTILSAMLEKTPPKWGIGVLDPQDEIQLSKKFPWLNSNTMVTGQYRTPADCFKQLLKMARDVLCVSEIAGWEEYIELIKSASRLNAGVSATMHNDGPEEVIPNCADLGILSGQYTDRYSAELAAAKSFNLIYHMRLLRSGRIVVDSVTEVIPVPRDQYIDDLRTGDDYTIKQKMSKVLDMFQQYLFRKMYSKPYRLQTLIKYNDASENWDVVGTPSDNYYRAVGKHLTEREMAKLRSLFTPASVVKESVAV